MKHLMGKTTPPSLLYVHYFVACLVVGTCSKTCLCQLVLTHSAERQGDNHGCLLPPSPLRSLYLCCLLYFICSLAAQSAFFAGGSLCTEELFLFFTVFLRRNLLLKTIRWWSAHFKVALICSMLFTRQMLLTIKFSTPQIARRAKHCLKLWSLSFFFIVPLISSSPSGLLLTNTIICNLRIKA